MLQHDNVSARKKVSYMKTPFVDVGVETFGSPAQSPVLNPT